MNILIIAAVIACAWADKVQFKDCGSKDGTITSVDISGCPKFPCPLVRGTNVTVQVVFTSKVATKTATASVHGVIAHIPVPFPIPNTDGCKTGVKCPVASGSAQTYNNQIFVSTMYPKVQVVVKWELEDEQGNDMFCFVIPAQIQDA